jgi:hypothetical protein
VAADIDSGNNRVQLKTAFTSADRFPDLRNKRVWQGDIEVIPTPDVHIRRDGGSLEQVTQVAVGESSWPSTVLGIDVSVVEDSDMVSRMPARLPKFVRDGLREIDKSPAHCSLDHTIVVVCPEGMMEPVFGLPKVLEVPQPF